MEQLIEWFELTGIGEDAALLAARLTGIAVVLLLAWLANLVAKRIILRIVDNVISKSRQNWLKVLQEKRVLSRFSHVAPAIVIYWLAPVALQDWETVTSAAHLAVRLYLVVIFLMVIDAGLNAVVAGYERYSRGSLPIKGFVQAIKLVVFLLGAILIVSIAVGQELLVLLSGFGALTAVLMLIFRDPILGLVAGVQLSANDMVKKGDWIEMPQQGADGDVIDVSLTTVKVQNWDRTITNIPSYSLISDSFRNWRGMQQAGGRRMKRSLLIDLRSIRFVDRELLDRLRTVRLLEAYLDSKLKEIDDYNRERRVSDEDLINGRHLTNIGCFRAYCAEYLRNHPRVHQEMIQISRQLDPTPHGLPLEVYAFARETAWVNYEGIQSDIFDHLFAVLPFFGLRLFQQPSGADLDTLAQSLAARNSPPPDTPDPRAEPTDP